MIFLNVMWDTLIECLKWLDCELKDIKFQLKKDDLLIRCAAIVDRPISDHYGLRLLEIWEDRGHSFIPSIFPKMSF